MTSQLSVIVAMALLSCSAVASDVREDVLSAKKPALIIAAFSREQCAEFVARCARAGSTDIRMLLRLAQLLDDQTHLGFPENNAVEVRDVILLALGEVHDRSFVATQTSGNVATKEIVSWKDEDGTIYRYTIPDPTAEQRDAGTTSARNWLVTLFPSRSEHQPPREPIGEADVRSNQSRTEQDALRANQPRSEQHAEDQPKP